MAEQDLMLRETGDPFALRDPELGAAAPRPEVHRFGAQATETDPPPHKCATDSLGHANPEGRDPDELRVDAHLGFVPLWETGTTLRWRFNESSFAVFENPEAAKQAVRRLMAEALAAWGESVPVRFSEQRDLYDFEVVMQPRSDCDISGCVLASAFFPDGGRHELVIYPTMFEQVREDQVETLAHEFGHVFGLRHWFANRSELGWPSEEFGDDSRFTIMNYGSDCVLTDVDRRDLKRLYTLVWSGALRALNGTPIRLFRPFSARLAEGMRDLPTPVDC